MHSSKSLLFPKWCQAMLPLLLYRVSFLFYFSLISICLDYCSQQSIPVVGAFSTVAPLHQQSHCHVSETTGRIRQQPRILECKKDSSDDATTNTNLVPLDEKTIFYDESYISNRRSFFLGKHTPTVFVTAALISSVTSSSSALAIPSTTNTNADAISQTTLDDFKCLLDLPPQQANNVVRIYLCRHGQTENNRLHLVQGARVDPPLNLSGRKMAACIGRALWHLKESGVMPRFGVHSKLKRAKETAIFARNILGASDESGNDAEFLDGLSSSMMEINLEAQNYQWGNKEGIQLKTMASLGEVDFGSVNDGKSETQARADMYFTFGMWAMGLIDARPHSGGGESGREVLVRAAEALTEMAELGVHNGGFILAVSHSFYLRMLLALVLDLPLSLASSLEQRNGCINVFDVEVGPGSSKKTIRIGPKSNLFNGKRSLAPDDFSLEIPKVTVVRINEVRHMNGLS